MNDREIWLDKDNKLFVCCQNCANRDMNCKHTNNFLINSKYCLSKSTSDFDFLVINGQKLKKYNPNFNYKFFKPILNEFLTEEEFKI